MNAATERIEEMLRARERSFKRDEDKEMVNTGFHGKNARWRVMAGGYNDFTVLILSVFPIECPKPERHVCAELLTRINYGLAVGCFEMDHEQGRIHFKTTVPYDKELPQLEVLDMLLGLNLSAMDRYLPAIMSVIYAGTTPEKALMEIERQEKAKAQSKTEKATEQQDLVRRRFELN
jgi:hypothetical protein